MKRLRVRWLEPASLDLIEIVEFVRKGQPAAARRLALEFLRSAARLSKSPRAGRIVPELQAQGISDYRELLLPPYRVLYAARTYSIDILAVMDGRRDFELTLFQRLLR